MSSRGPLRPRVGAVLTAPVAGGISLLGRSPRTLPLALFVALLLLGLGLGLGVRTSTTRPPAVPLDGGADT